MPTKPKRPCSYPGCPNLTNELYCPEHAKLVASHYNRYGRTEQMKHRYAGSWPKIRRAYITAHPLCEQCLKEGRITPAAEVHHIRPLADGGTSAEENLMALCKPCHSRVTAKEGGRWG